MRSCRKRAVSLLLVFSVLFVFPLLCASQSLSQDAHSEALEVQLPEPFLEYILQRERTLQRVLDLPESFTLSAGFAEGSCDNPYLTWKQGTPTRAGLHRSFLPFPSGCQKNNEKESERGMKELWNAQSHWWRKGYFASSGKLKAVDAAGDQQILQFRHQRVFPGFLEQLPPNQLFRERYALFGTDKDSALQWMTFRFLGPAEDLVWYFSPHIHQVRKITGVNREDSLLRTGQSLDDVLFFSRKLESMKVIETEERDWLVPLAAKSASEPLSTEDGCIEVRSASFRRGESFRIMPGLIGLDAFIEHMQWESFYPRKVVKITLESENPYFSRTREVLYLDSALHLPVYRVSYDVLGRLQRTSFQVLGLSRLSSGEVFPVIKKIVSYDHSTGKLSEMSFFSKKWCPVTEQIVHEFQPAKMIPQKPEVEPAQQERDRSETEPSSSVAPHRKLEEEELEEREFEEEEILQEISVGALGAL